MTEGIWAPDENSPPLSFDGLGLANVGQKAGMRGAALRIVGAGFFEAELAVDGKTDVGSVVVFLTVIFPPADRAQLEGCGSIESLVTAAGATEAHFDVRAHTKMDGEPPVWITGDCAHTVFVDNRPPWVCSRGPH